MTYTASSPLLTTDPLRIDTQALAAHVNRLGGDRATETREYIEAVVRASAYLAALPPAVSGQGGHDATMNAAIALVRGFALDPHDALDLLEHEFNPRCSPPWSLRELAHKVESAQRAQRVGLGYLLEKGAA